MSGEEAGHRGRVNARALVEELRYWVPSVKDVALVQECQDGAGLRFFLIPSTPGACPVELLLRNDGLFDLEVGGISYEAQELGARTALIDLLEGITAGQVIQRRFYNPATGAPVGVETRIRLPDGSYWRAGDMAEMLPGAMSVRDRHYLPYRR